MYSYMYGQNLHSPHYILPSAVCTNEWRSNTDLAEDDAPQYIDAIADTDL